MELGGLKPQTSRVRSGLESAATSAIQHTEWPRLERETTVLSPSERAQIGIVGATRGWGRTVDPPVLASVRGEELDASEPPSSCQCFSLTAECAI